ncbi:MAG: cation:proton antiporter [Methanoculleaceae archaeon]
MEVILGIAVVLICAKALGELAERAGIPAMVGEIMAGILLGPALLDLVEFEGVIRIFSDIGVITLLFISGVEINTRAFSRNRNAAASTAIAGVAIPFLLGLAAGRIFGISLTESLFLATVLSITSIGVTVGALIELKALSTRPGAIIVGAAVIDDLIGVVLLAVLLPVSLTGAFSLKNLLVTIVLAGIFLAVSTTVGKRVLGWLFDRVHHARTHEIAYSAALITALLLAAVAASIGLHYGIGAFIGGVILGDHIRKDRALFDSLVDISFGFFVPFFFASIGLMFVPDIGDISLVPPVLILFAFIGKMVGGFVGSYPFLRETIPSLLVGVGICPRGEISLVVAQAAFAAGLISPVIFQAVTVMIIVMVLVPPVLLKYLYRLTGLSTAHPAPSEIQ